MDTAAAVEPVLCVSLYCQSSDNQDISHSVYSKNGFSNAYLGYMHTPD